MSTARMLLTIGAFGVASFLTILILGAVMELLSVLGFIVRLFTGI